MLCKHCGLFEAAHVGAERLCLFQHKAPFKVFETAPSEGLGGLCPGCNGPAGLGPEGCCETCWKGEPAKG